MNKNYQVIHKCLRVLFLPILIGMMSSCFGGHSPRCAELAKKHKSEKQYSEKHQPTLSTVKVYVENSGSMDGYVNGNTEFKTDLFNLLKLLGGDISGEIEKHFINDSIIKVRISDSQFSNGMSVTLFQQMGGKRETSDIAELMAKVIKSNKPGEVSIFVSDCVFDPQSDPDIEKRLSQQKTTIQSAIKNKLKSDDEFSVVVYKLMSSFTGTYFNKVKPHTFLNNEQRPYYMWFFGDACQLTRVRELLNKDIESRGGTQVFSETNLVENIPYRCPAAKCNKAKGKHIDEPRESRGKFTFNINVDLSTLPLTQDFLLTTSNYILPKNNDYLIKSVDKYKKKEKSFTHEIKISKIKGNIKEHTSVIVELKRPTIPSWVEEFNDPLGTDYLNGKRPTKPRTFGLSSYITGVHDAYGDTPIASFEILIK